MPIDLNHPQVAAAIIGGGVAALVSIIVAAINQLFLRSLHNKRLDFDREQAERRSDVELRLMERKFELDADLAERRLRLDADLADRKRKQDLAEQVLSGFYQMQDVVKFIRSPLSYSSESKARPKEPSEPEAVGRLRDAYFAVLARFEQRRQAISDLLAKEYQVVAWFGSTAAEPFKVLNNALLSVTSSAQTLIDMAAHEPRDDDERRLRRELERDIWWGKKPDTIESRIAEAVQMIEGIVRPILQTSAI